MGVEPLGLIAAGSVTGGLVAVAMVGVAWVNRDRPAATPFGWLMLAISGWCFFVAAQLLADAPAEAYAFERLVRLAAANAAPLGLTFVLTYAGHDEWLTPRWLGLLWLPPTAYVAASLTAPFHGFASTPADVTFRSINGVTAAVVPVGPAKQLHLVFAYVVIAVAYVVLFRLLLRTRSTHRGQATLVAVGALFPFLANVGYYLGATPHPGVDVTPLAFALSGIVFGWGLFRYDFLAVTPVASDVLVDELPDPVLVLDEDDRVVDYNAAATDAFGAGALGDERLTDVAPGLLERVETGGVYSLPERHVADGGSTRFYDPQVAPLDDQHGSARGRLVVLRDVTGQQRRQDRLEALQTATQQFIAAATHEQIAQLTVDFLERALDHHAGCVFLVDDGGTSLEPVAETEYARDYDDGEVTAVDGDHPMFEAFENGERVVYSPDDDSSFRQCVVFPLGEHGVLGIGSHDEEPLANDDEQFATILARTTQVALSQVDRESDLRESRASVERRSEQIAFFNGVLRHTLRNALLVIQGRADHLRDHVDGDRGHHLDVIERWCDDLTELSDEIRAINDTVTATESERLDTVDLTNLLYERVRAAELEYDDVTVDVDVGDDLCVQANALAGRVLDSVFENAIEHHDGDVATVEIATQRAADRVQVHVADDGPGISDELKGTVFERDLATNQTASGFGLYFVSVIMNLYGGTVWFEDNDPRGTVAVLEFQAAE